jgi:hypothetical protein
VTARSRCTILAALAESALVTVAAAFGAPYPLSTGDEGGETSLYVRNPASLSPARLRARERIIE